jgi:hypothetical protein
LRPIGFSASKATGDFLRCSGAQDAEFRSPLSMTSSPPTAFAKTDTEGHERSVPRELSTPVSQLCFEVTSECIEAGIECVDIVASLGRYQFNFSFMDGNALDLDWQGASTMNSFLSRYTRDNRGIGDVYARLHCEGITP